MSLYGSAINPIPSNAAAVTPSDTVNFDAVGTLYVGGDGDVAIVTESGDVVTLSSVSAGTFIPVACIRVNSTNTTAANIVVLW